jgi:hypothetical protein
MLKSKEIFAFFCILWYNYIAFKKGGIIMGKKPDPNRKYRYDAGKKYRENTATREPFVKKLNATKAANDEHDYTLALKLSEELMKTLGSIKEEGLKRSTLFEYYRALGCLKHYKRSLNGITKLILTELEDPISEVYTCDYYLIQLSKICIKNNDIENAKKYLKMIRKPSYLNEANLWLGYIEMKYENYDEAIEYIEKVVVDKNTENAGAIIADKLKALNFIKKQIGKERYYPKGFEKCHSYHISQIENYSEKAAKKHLLSHTETEDYDEPIRESLFLPCIDIEKLFEEVKGKLSEETLYGFSDIDRYIVPMGKIIGTVKGGTTDTVTAVTFLNQPDKILTIYPCPSLKLNKKVRK